jgi:hypothetical protein
LLPFRLTDGREVENYIPVALMQSCVEAVNPGCGKAVRDEKFEHAVPYRKDDGRYFVDKLKVAHQVVSKPAVLDRYDLRQRVDQIVAFIRVANQ